MSLEHLRAKHFAAEQSWRLALDELATKPDSAAAKKAEARARAALEAAAAAYFSAKLDAIRERRLATVPEATP